MPLLYSVARWSYEDHAIFSDILGYLRVTRIPDLLPLLPSSIAEWRITTTVPPQIAAGITAHTGSTSFPTRRVSDEPGQLHRDVHLCNSLVDKDAVSHSESAPTCR
jgi:hypothetical protein